VQEVCRCSDNYGLDVLLDSRLIIVIVIWAVLLSIIILIIFLIIAVDRSPPRLVRVPSYPDLHRTKPDNTLPTFHSLDSSMELPGMVRTGSSESLSEDWMQNLRDENWILYPASATVISHRRTYADNRNSLGDLYHDVTM